MKIMMMAALLAGMRVGAAEAAEPMVTVCIESGVSRYESLAAQAIAGKMFADIGVRIDWHTESACPAGQDGVIHISLTTGEDATRHPVSLAIALAYEGVHIQVFVDRVRRLVTPKCMPTLLAHVLAHEITHILQGVDRHSECGVMKATWSQEDYEDMAWKPLRFTDEDVKLIHSGLDVRAAGGAPGWLAANSTPAFAAQ